jgi:hypothetical protein
VSIYDEFQNGKRYKIHDLLTRFGGSQATNPRDKVFALLGLAASTRLGNGSGLEPTQTIINYTRSVQETFIHVAEVLIQQDASVDKLLAAGIGWKRSIPGLPSWVTDWTELPETLLGGFARAAVRYQAGHADFNRDNYSVQSRLLYVHNTAVFDTISAMTYEIDHDNREVSDWYSSSPHWFQQLCSIVQEQLSALEEDELDHDGFQR